MICKLCGNGRTLIKAHIIPEPFFTDVPVIGGRAKILSNVPGTFPKRSPTGVYDASILCGPCDNTLGRWDDYGIELLSRGLAEFTPVSNEAGLVFFVRTSFDYAKLKLFFLSVLWRAGESSHPFFRRVRLGPYSQRIRHLLLAGDPGEASDFGTVLAAFTVDGQLPTQGLPIADPFRERWDGVNAYRLSFGIITAHIAVDQRPLGPLFARFCLRSDGPLHLIERDFRRSSEQRVIQGIASAPLNRREFEKKPPRDDGG